MRFRDRQDAGHRLTERLIPYAAEKPIVIALPRGGLPIGYEIATRMNVPLDIVVVRKIGHPENPEYGIGAIAEDGEFWTDPEVLVRENISSRELRPVMDREKEEVRRRVLQFREGRPASDVKGKTVLLVDDGLATGVTAMVAAQLLRRRGARKIVLAVPVCALSTMEMMRSQVDEIICLSTPSRFFAVSLWYEDFSQVTDDDVVQILRSVSMEGMSSREVQVTAGPMVLPGTLTVPAISSGIVIFAHGSGSSRHSPRNLKVARSLNEAGIATLLFDLLSPEEALDRRNVFDIPLLAQRLVASARWTLQNPETRSLPLGFFGASTGGGAAIWAASVLGEQVVAVVSRGGRPDLAEPVLEQVRSPVLLLVGGDDFGVIELNEAVLGRLPDASLDLIPGATHLFEEAGALEEVSSRAADFFLRHFQKAKGVEAA